MDLWGDYLGQVFEAPDRISVIVGAEMLSLALERLLDKHFVQSRELRKRLFESPNAPLGTFSNRIDIAFACGLLEEYEYTNFHCIRDLRNAAAHDPMLFDINAGELRHIVAKLTSPYMHIPSDGATWFRNLVHQHFNEIYSRAQSCEPHEPLPTDHSAMAKLEEEHDAWVERLIQEEGFTIRDGILIAPPGYRQKGQHVSGGMRDGVVFSEVRRDGDVVFRAQGPDGAIVDRQVRDWLAANPWKQADAASSGAHERPLLREDDNATTTSIRPQDPESV